jgi:hypothetical protein
MLNQFLSLVVAPSGIGDPGPLRFSLTTHRIDRGKTRRCADECPFSLSVGDGDQRLDPTAEHPAAEAQRRSDLLFLGLARKAFDRLESAGAALHGLLSRHV